MKRHFFLIVTGLMIFLLPLSGQSQLSLSLEQARKHALEYNKTLKSAGYAVTKSQMALREAIANGLPQVSASMDYSNALGAKISIRFAENMPASEIDIKPQSNMYVNVNQLIFSGNYIVGVQMAKVSRELSKINQEKSTLEVIAQVTDAYHMAVISTELQSLLGQNLKNLKELYEKTNALARAGLIEQTDVDQLSVQVSSLENALSSAGRQSELALNLLRLHLGVDMETSLVLTDKLPFLMQDTYSEQMVLKQLALEDQIDYRMLTQQENLTGKNVNMQRANALPNLAAFYRYTYKLLKPDFDMTPANMVGLQLNIPLFSSGVRTYQTQQARLDLKTIQNQKDLLSDQLRLQDKQLRYNLSTALDAYHNQQKSVEVSRRVYQHLKLKYEQGLISGLDLISADNNYVRAETDYISAMMEVLNARVQLEKLYGHIQ